MALRRTDVIFTDTANVGWYALDVVYPDQS